VPKTFVAVYSSKRRRSSESARLHPELRARGQRLRAFEEILARSTAQDPLQRALRLEELVAAMATLAC
jgi:hypothetical protein